MTAELLASTQVETNVYLKKLCEDARELRETAQQLRASSHELRLRCQAAVLRAQASRALAAELTMPQPRVVLAEILQALNC